MARRSIPQLVVVATGVAAAASLGAAIEEARCGPGPLVLAARHPSPHVLEDRFLGSPPADHGLGLTRTAAVSPSAGGP